MDLVKNLLKSYYLYTLPSDVRCSTDVRSFLIARTSGHFHNRSIYTDVRNPPDVRHFHNRNISTDVRNPPAVRHFHNRSVLTDVRPRSDVLILYTGLWVTLFTAAGRPMAVGRPGPFGPPDGRPSCTPNGHFFPPPIYIPFPSTG